MELTTKQIKEVKFLLLQGFSYIQVAAQLQLSFNEVRRLSGFILQNELDETITITTALPVIQQTEKELFDAIADYHANPTLFNSDRVNELSSIYSRQKLL